MSNNRQERQAIQLQASAGVISTVQLQSLLTTYAEQFAYMMLANSEICHFKMFNLNEASTVEQWTEGQVFGAESELRWRRKGELFAACLLDETSLSFPTCLSIQVRPGLIKHEVRVRLWGEHQATDRDTAEQAFWMEAQIPRLLFYPVVGEPALVALRVAQYLQDDGSIGFVRFVGLEAW